MTISEEIKRFGKPIYRVFRSSLPKNRLGDKAVALIDFLRQHHRFPRNRNLFNDVLYQIKVSDEIFDPLRVFVSDKELVKLYVRAIVGEEHNVPTIGILRSPAEVALYDFPSDCCIKPTHTSGAVILRTNNSAIDVDKIRSWFAVNLYAHSREANYRYLIPKVIVEPLIFGRTDVDDYKFFCVDGRVKLIQVDTDRHTGHRRTLLTPDWSPQSLELVHPAPDEPPAKPANLHEMLEIAKKLSSNFSFVRIDLYSDDKTCLVGEITNCHGGANEVFRPRSAEHEASRLLFG